MRNPLLSALAPVALVAVWTIGLAQGAPKAAPEASDALKPVVVVSFAGYDRALQALETIDKLGGSKLAAQADSQLKKRLQIESLDGIDTKRPWGVLVQTDGSGFPRWVSSPSPT